jgi:hypothetical protein
MHAHDLIMEILLQPSKKGHVKIAAPRYANAFGLPTGTAKAAAKPKLPTLMAVLLAKAHFFALL